MWRGIRRMGIHQLQGTGERGIEHETDVAWILLSIFVDSRDPIACCACHTRERGSMLSVVSRQPDRTDERILSSERFNYLVRVVRTTVMHNEDFTNEVTVTVRSSLCIGQRPDLTNQG